MLHSLGWWYVSGLLAGMWEFPSEIQPKDKPPPDMLRGIDEKYGISIHKMKEKIPVGEVMIIYITHNKAAS